MLLGHWLKKKANCDIKCFFDQNQNGHAFYAMYRYQKNTFCVAGFGPDDDRKKQASKCYSASLRNAILRLASFQSC
jgi:hypothetical protein